MASYYVIKSYATKQNFISRHSAELMWSKDNSKADVYTEADVIVKKDDNHLFQVDLLVDISAIATVSQRTIFDINIIFTSLVFIDETISEQERERILMVDVPNAAFISVQDMVKQMTNNAGYNALLIDFNQRYQCNKRHSVEEK